MMRVLAIRFLGICSFLFVLYAVAIVIGYHLATSIARVMDCGIHS